jgi:hypothetical protein
VRSHSAPLSYSALHIWSKFWLGGGGRHERATGVKEINCILGLGTSKESKTVYRLLWLVFENQRKSEGRKKETMNSQLLALSPVFLGQIKHGKLGRSISNIPDK